MKAIGTCAFVIGVAVAWTAHADKTSDKEAKDSAADAAAEQAQAEVDQIVLINATAKLNDTGQIERLRRVLDSRHLLHRLPEHLEEALDGRAVLVGDLDQIKDAYMQLDYASALKMIEGDEGRVLAGAVGGDPVPALAELCQWRGLIAIAQEQPNDAVRYFRAAYRLNPAWTLEKKFASPSVRAIAKKAHREPSETGVLRVDADPDDAKVMIDGGEPQAAGKIELPIGMHLVRITAKDRAPYAEMVEINAKKTEKLSIMLDKETNSLRAARLVDETAAAPPGQARLRDIKALSHITGAKRYLVIEDGGDDHVTVRVYDVASKKVSKEFDLQGTESSAAIARLVTAALEVDNMIDAGSVTITASLQKKEWYQHWYVWAAVGAVAIGAGATYELMSRSPTSVRGFE